ncbi:DUF2809 domain-containing protein [bacterium]|nr:DUF2809 domain-containing protein [bacterium]
MVSIKRLRWKAAGIMIVIIPLGFYTKLYRGSMWIWVNHSLGGVLYEIFWCLFIVWLWPRAKPVRIAFWVFLVTCCLELLQLWHPFFLEKIRGTYLGQALFGTTFTWWDFPHYIIGSVIGGWMIDRLQRATC